MKVQSTIQPQEIYIDKIKNGRARLLVRWNLETVTRIDEMTEEEQTIYKYDETALWWTFPDSYQDSSGSTVYIDTMSDLQAYLDSNKSEILSFARGTKIDADYLLK
jgi:hypothetical protein